LTECSSSRRRRR